MRSLLLVLPLCYRLLRASAEPIPDIVWVDCAPIAPQAFANLTSSIPTTLRCGSIQLPMDYTQEYSANNSFQVGFSIYTPVNATRLFNFNSGGPEDAVSPYVWDVAFNTTDGQDFKQASDYAFLGIDPRGAGTSQSYNCSVGLNTSSLADPIIDTEEAYNALQAAVKANAASCVPQAALQFGGSETIAQDWNAIRDKLGYDKMSLLGYSYGSKLGAKYVELFPQHSANVALDGIFLSSMSAEEDAKIQLTAYTRLIQRADAFCMVNDQCPYHGQGKGAITTALVNVIQKASNGSFGDLDGDDVRASMFFRYINGLPDFPALATALSAALNQGNISGFDYFENLAPLISASLPIVFPAYCADIGILSANGSDLTWDEYNGILQRVSAVDLYGINSSIDLILTTVCGAWPLKLPLNTTIIDPAIPILLVASDFDGNTPIENAITYYNATTNTTLLVRHGDLHGTFDVPGPARDAEWAFINTGVMPADAETDLYSVYSHSDPSRQPSVKDPYTVVLGVDAGDISSTQNITFSAKNSTSPPIQQGGGANGVQKRSSWVAGVCVSIMGMLLL